MLTYEARHTIRFAVAIILTLGVRAADAAPAYQFQTLSDYPTAILTEPTDINNAGIIIGAAVLPSSASTGFVLSGGSYTPLNYPGTPSGTAPLGINLAGDIVGNQTFLGVAFREGGGTFLTLTSTGGTVTAAGAIDDAGHIAGSLSTGAMFIQTGGSDTVASRTGYMLVPEGITNTGQVVGVADSVTQPTAPHQGFLYNGGALFQISLPGDNVPGGDVAANDINNNGDIVGCFGCFNVGSGHGFLYTGGAFYQVDFPNSLSTQVTGINDAGQLVGYYFDQSSVEHGFLASLSLDAAPLPPVNGSIDPISEPASLALLAVGIAGLGMVHRRKAG